MSRILSYKRNKSWNLSFDPTEKIKCCTRLFNVICGAFYREPSVFRETSRIFTELLNMYVRAGRPAFSFVEKWGSVGLHLILNSFLLLQQCHACLIRQTWIVFVMGGRWPYSWCLVGCCRQDLFNIARNILV